MVSCIVETTCFPILASAPDSIFGLFKKRRLIDKEIPAPFFDTQLQVVIAPCCLKNSPSFELDSITRLGFPKSVLPSYALPEAYSHNVLK